MVRAIASHADYLGVSRENAMELTLHAVGAQLAVADAQAKRLYAVPQLGDVEAARKAEAARRIAPVEAQYFEISSITIV